MLLVALGGFGVGLWVRKWLATPVGGDQIVLVAILIPLGFCVVWMLAVAAALVRGLRWARRSAIVSSALVAAMAFASTVETATRLRNAERPYGAPVTDLFPAIVLATMSIAVVLIIRHKRVS